jgi:hypothetical protein
MAGSWLNSCPSSRLTESEVAWLDSLSQAAHQVDGPVQCELEVGHPDEAARSVAALI